jgi:hypothetical protein
LWGINSIFSITNSSIYSKVVKMSEQRSIDLEQIIKDWGKLNDYPNAIVESLAVVERLEALWGPVVEAYVPQQTKPHVAMKFEKNEGHNQAWINVGHVDYRYSFEDSVESGHSGIGRTRLSNSKGGSVRGPKSGASIPTTQCPELHNPFPITGSCECGWKI